MMNRNVIVGKNLEQYKKITKNYKHPLIQLSKEQVESYDNSYKGVLKKKNALLDGHRWFFYNNTYYEIPNDPKHWFRSLHTAWKVSIVSLLGCAVLTGIVVPSAFAIQNAIAPKVPEVFINMSVTDVIAKDVKFSDDKLSITLINKDSSRDFSNVKIKIGDYELKEDEYKIKDANDSSILVLINKPVIDAHNGKVVIVPQFVEYDIEIKGHHNVDLLDNSTFKFTVKSNDKEVSGIKWTFSGDGIESIGDNGVIVPNPEGGSAVITASKNSLKYAEFHVEVGSYGCLDTTKFISGEIKLDSSKEIPNDVIIPSRYHNNSEWVTFNKISNEAFLNQTNVSKVFIPKTITQIGSSAFKGCTNLTKFIVSSDNTKLRSDSATQSILIGIESDGNESIISAPSVTGVVDLTSISSKLKTIKSYAFANTQLTKITLPTTVSVVESNAFLDANNLKDVVFSKTDKLWKTIKTDLSSENVCVSNSEVNAERLISTSSSGIANRKWEITSTDFKAVTSIDMTICRKEMSKDDDSIQLKATCLPSDCFDKEVYWYVKEDSKSVVDVNKKTGVLTLKDPQANSATLIAKSVSNPEISNEVTIEFLQPLSEDDGLVFQQFNDDFSNEYYKIEQTNDLPENIPSKFVVPAKHNDCYVTGFCSWNGSRSGREGAFQGWVGIHELILNSHVISIEGNAFQGCTSSHEEGSEVIIDSAITKLVLNEEIQTIGDWSLTGCQIAPNDLYDYYRFPSSLIEIGYGAFQPTKYANIFWNIAFESEGTWKLTDNNAGTKGTFAAEYDPTLDAGQACGYLRWQDAQTVPGNFLKWQKNN